MNPTPKSPLSLFFLALLCASLFSLHSEAREVTATVQGRAFKIFLPSNYDRDRGEVQWPLFILLHGYGSNGAEQIARLGLHRYTDQKQFILAVPEGTVDRRGKRFWNATPFCCNFYQSKVDDVEYLRELITHTTQGYAINPRHVFVLGHSNGAFMANRLACEISGILGGIITVGGTAHASPSECLAPAPLHVLHIHGTHDQTILYQGASGRYPGAIEMMGRWVKHNGCAQDEVIERQEDLDQTAGQETTVREWGQCETKKRTVLFSMGDVGHIPRFKPSFLEEVFKFIQSVISP